MTRYILIATATLAIGTAGLIGCKKDQTAQNTTDNRTAGEKTRDAVTKAGEKTGEGLGTAVDKTKEAAQTAGEKLAATTLPSPDAAIKKTRATLAKVVEAAVTKDGLGDVVDHFTKADRDRIGKLDKSTWGDLNAAIEKFRADWKAKYNQDFKLTDKEEVVFGAPVEIQIGPASGARLASERTPADTAAPADNAADKTRNNVTHVSFPAANGAPAVTVQLENEGTLTSSYKIDVPTSLDGNRLRDNLTMTINKLDAMKDTWPSDANQAYRMVAQYILAAITNTNTQ
jgi:hypothetical protein